MPASRSVRTARSTSVSPPNRTSAFEPPQVTARRRSDRPAASTTPRRGTTPDRGCSGSGVGGVRSPFEAASRSDASGTVLLLRATKGSGGSPASLFQHVEDGRSGRRAGSSSEGTCWAGSSTSMAGRRETRTVVFEPFSGPSLCAPPGRAVRRPLGVPASLRHERGDVAHDPVGERLDVGPALRVAFGVDRLSVDDCGGGPGGRGEGQPRLRPAVLHAPQAYWDHRGGRNQGDPGGSLLPRQEPRAVAYRSLGGDPREHPSHEHARARLDRRPVTEAAADRDLAGLAQAPTDDGPFEVFDQREEMNGPSPLDDGEGDEHGVDHADVVVREERAAARGDVPGAHHPEPERRLGQGPEGRPAHIPPEIPFARVRGQGRRSSLISANRSRDRFFGVSQALSVVTSNKSRLHEIVPELPRPGRMAELAERLRLDLPDPLPGDAELPPDLLERPRLPVGQAEPELDDPPLSN